MMSSKRAAQLVIDSLRGPRADVLQGYKAGQRDFVFVEESLSHLRTGDYDTALALVFGWLRDVHGVQRPLDRNRLLALISTVMFKWRGTDDDYRAVRAYLFGTRTAAEFDALSSTHQAMVNDVDALVRARAR